MSDLYGDLSLRVTTEVHIRPARADDLGLLSRWNSSVDRVIVPTLQRQASGQALVLVAMLGPWPVGHLLVDFTRLADSAASYLWHMGVHDTFRNHGIGSGLISMAESEGRTRGLNFAQLEVEKSNRDALRLYEKLGYLIVCEEDSVWSEPDENGRPHDVSHPCWVMRKPLSTEAAVPRLSRWAVSPGWCPRPRPTSSLLQAVCDHYAIDALGKPVDLGGSSNLNLRLTAAGGGAYVLRVHRAWVTAERLDAVNKVRRHLIGRGLPFVGAVPTRAGVYGIRVGEHLLVELEPYVEGQGMDLSEALLTGMRMLACVHAELRGVSAKGAAVAPVANHIGAEVARIFARRGAAIIRSRAMDPSDGGLAGSLERVAEELWEAERPYVQYLSPQLVS